jgi:hypothetical protein
VSDSYPTASGQNSTCNHPRSLPASTRTVISPIQNSEAIHEPRNQRDRLVVGPEGAFSGRYGPCRSRTSSAQKTCFRYDCLTHRAHRLGEVLMAKEGKRDVEKRRWLETVHTAVQDIVGRKFSGHPEQPMRTARGRGCAATGSSTETINAQGLSSVNGGQQMTQRRCGEVHRSVVICLGGDRIRPISCSTPREDTAFRPPTLFTPSCPRITCDDGDGDIKPAHPSGPGTYGHAM